MEFQAKELFAKHDVPVTLGHRRETPEEARAAAEQLGGRVVVKAQVKAGGRGKAGGVKLAKTPDEAEAHAEAILGMQIKGLTVNRVLIAPAADIEEEYYFSFLLDRANRRYLCIASVEGGVEIEEVAEDQPDAVSRSRSTRAPVSTRPRRARSSPTAGFPEPLTDQAVRPCRRCGRSSSRRTPRWSRSTRWPGSPTASSRRSTARSRSTRTPSSGTATTRRSRTRPRPTRWRPKAKAKGLNYVKLDGAVGIIGNGAGLVMSTLDVVAYAGEAHGGVKPANFLDIGGGASAQVMADGLDVILRDQQVKARLRQRLRRHHRRATRSPTASSARSRSSATRPPSRSSYAWTATTSTRAVGS